MAPTKTIQRYNPATVQTIVNQLQQLIDVSQEAYDNEEAKDYPNDERMDSLDTRITGLQEALDALEGIL